MIQVDNLTRIFGTFKAVDDISIHVSKGELYCFLGPNGAGKTTTIKMLCGLLKSTSGNIRIGGIDMAKDPVSPRRFTGYIPDTPFLYERLTATEFFEFTGDLYRIPREKVNREREKYFEMFGLKDHADSLVKDFSHGMRQRLIYAVTFLHDPRILFVDEPFVGLDPYSIRLIHDMLRRKVESGTTVFLTTHILAFAQNLADRIGIISHGKLVAEGTLDELLDSGKASLEDVFLSLTGDNERRSAG